MYYLEFESCDSRIKRNSVPEGLKVWVEKTRLLEFGFPEIEVEVGHTVPSVDIVSIAGPWSDRCVPLTQDARSLA